MLPELYQNHLKKQFKLSDYLFLEILVNLLQSLKQVSLEKLASSLPLPITFESRRKKIQRFLSLPQLNVKSSWLSYKKRFGIEEMFRDFKKGGYNLEGTKVSGDRLISLLILISIAYTISTLSGQKIKKTGIQKYVGRIKKTKRTFPRHSNFYVGLYGYTWVHFCSYLSDKITQLMNLSPNKRPFYQRGKKAMTLILSAF